MTLLDELIAKHATHDQQTHGNRATPSGTYDLNPTSAPSPWNDRGDAPESVKDRYDRVAADYGLNYDRSYVDHPAVLAANAIPKAAWENVPISDIDPTEVVATENELRSYFIDRVVGGEVPMREGYAAKTVRLDDGTLVLIDGHHRAAMAAGLGITLASHVIDEADLSGVAKAKKKKKRSTDPNKRSSGKDIVGSHGHTSHGPSIL